jgi:hypothetical protein
MKNKNLIVKLALSLSIIVTVGVIIYIINKNGTVIDFSTSLLALIGSGIGFGLSLLLKKASARSDKRKIFLTYNMNDKDFAMKISSDLKDNNIIVFNENEIIHPGDTLGKIIEDYIIASDKIIVIVSKTTYKSKFLKSEIELAKKNKKIIVPILKEEAEIPNFLSSYKFADFRQDYGNSIKDLISSI